MSVSVQDLIRAEARRQGVNPALALAVARAESGFNQGAVSPAGAIGVMQLMPGTARGLGVNPRDLRQNIQGGVRYLAQQLRAFGGDPRLALAAYNAGPGAVQRHGGVPPFAETQKYVPTVMRYMQEFGGGGSGGAPVAADGGADPGYAQQMAAVGGGMDPRWQQLMALREMRQAGREGRGNRLGAMLRFLGAQSGGGGAVGPEGMPDGPMADVPGGPGGFTMGGGPEDHARRALGDWQSDLAYDLMGKAGQVVRSPVTGRVVRISGQPGGNPQFAGYGITIQTQGGQIFVKHLGTRNVQVGQTVRPGMPLGTLDATTGGGPHIHLGASSRALLDRLVPYYVGRR